MDINNIQYWQDRYLQNSTGWDLGAVSPPLKAYFDQLSNKDCKILIPGAGNAYEAEYLHKVGATRVFVADWAQQAIDNVKKRMPYFPDSHLLAQDFFKLEGSFDLIVEQTFFCALPPQLRKEYVHKMHDLLAPNGKLVGLLFQVPLNQNHPPFGGNKAEYLSLFESKFEIITLDTAHNSIETRQDKELFFIFKAK